MSEHLSQHFDPRHVIYCTRRHFQDPHGDRQAVLIYDSEIEAHLGLRELLASDGLLWEHDDCLRAESGLILTIRPCKTTTRTLRQLVDYEPTTKELAFELSPNLVREARIVREGRMPTSSVNSKPSRRERKSSRGPTQAHPPGAVHVKDVALSLGVDARDCRRALRSIMQKPAYGWWFKPDELEDVKAKIREAL